MQAETQRSRWLRLEQTSNTLHICRFMGVAPESWRIVMLVFVRPRLHRCERLKARLQAARARAVFPYMPANRGRSSIKRLTLLALKGDRPLQADGDGEHSALGLTLPSGTDSRHSE